MKARPMTKKETVRYRAFIESQVVLEGVYYRDPRRLPRYGQDSWRGVKTDGARNRRAIA